MYDVENTKLSKCKKELRRKSLHGDDADTHTCGQFLQKHAQIHREWFEDEARVIAMKELLEKLNVETFSRMIMFRQRLQDVISFSLPFSSSRWHE